MINPFRALLVTIVIPAVCVFSVAQRPTTGVPTFGTVTNGFDQTNLANLNLHFRFPILNKAGRGTPFVYGLSYDSLVWAPANVATGQSWYPQSNWGWMTQGTAITGSISFTHSYTQCAVQDPPGGPIVIENEDTYSNVAYDDPGGTSHYVAGVDYEGPCPNRKHGFTANALDGSGYRIAFSNGVGTVTGRGGITISPPSDWNGPGSIVDNNGNILSTDGSNFIDTLGMTALTVTGRAPNPVSYTYSDTTGTPRSVVVNYTTYTVQTNFGAPGIGEYGPLENFLVSSIVYPDGSQYSFTYEATPGFPGAVTGRLTSVTLPTGGSISYTYTGGYNGILADGSTAGMSRTTADGTSSYTRVQSGDIWETTVTDVANNDTVYDFSGIYETQRRSYRGAAGGALLKRAFHCYNGQNSACETATVTAPITNKFDYTILDNVWFTQGNAYNSSGLLTTAEDYYEATGGNGALRRRTTITYAALGNNIVDKPSQVTVDDGNGNWAAHTTYAYDDTPLSPTSGVPQHLDGGNGARGNLTHSTRWLNTNPTASPVTAFNYDDTGQLLSITDPGGHTTSFAYSSNYANAYTTQTTAPATASPNAANHITSATYDLNTGLTTGSGDENGKTTSYSYDSVLRPSTISTPDGGQTTVTHLDPNQTLTQSKINSSARTIRYDMLDAYGRVSRTAVFNGEANTVWDQQDYCYNPQGAQQFVTYPYQGIGWADPKGCSVANGVISTTRPGDTTSFDPLGRPTQVKHSDNSYSDSVYVGRATSVVDESNGSTRVQRIYQSDGLGRLLSVCEVSSLPVSGANNAPAPCGLDIAGTGFLSTYDYDLLGNISVVRQGGINARLYNHDSLSRLITESSPESNNNVTSYTYDADGLLTQRMRPAANQTNPAVTVTTNYSYDALHRVTGKSYTDGVTPSSWFGYDYTVVWGHASDNGIGRLSVESSYINGTNLAVSAFWNYDAVGRLLGKGVCAPRTCSAGSAYDSLYTYDLLGNLTSETDGVGISFNYTYNGAPRLTGVTSNLSDAKHPGTLLSGVKYGVAGPTTSTLGDGLVEVRTYDPRLGLQSYKVRPIYSYDLTKAANGRVTAGNDSANGAWSYSYDPFNRLATAGKTGQAFAYDYDRFGNRLNQRLTAGSSGAQPSYSFDANNHIVNSGFSYDALGNVTNDGVHAYTYDAENRLIQVDGGAKASYTYDAEGQRVKIAKAGGVSSEFLYDLEGKAIVELDGSSGAFKRGEIFAGGHIATYADGTTYFPHQDWLGTKRVSTDPTGAVVETCTNLPFGDDGSCTGANASLISFTDFDHDSESNLEHAWFRQLSTTQGRWQSPDPNGGSMNLGNPQSLNRYAYASNNPVNFVDPLGLEDCPPGTEGTGSKGTCVTVTAGPDPMDPMEMDGWSWMRWGSWSWGGSGWVGASGTDFSQVLDTTMRWLSAPRNQNCTNALAAAGAVIGAGAGAQVGAGIGATAGAAGGTLVVPGVGTVGGAAVGAVGGGLAGGVVGGGIGAVGGGIVGWALCAQGTGGGGSSSPSGNKWSLGNFKSAKKWASQMAARGWTPQEIDEAIEHGQRFSAPNNINPANGATRYVNPITGRSVVLDNVTNEVIHVGGDGFKY